MALKVGEKQRNGHIKKKESATKNELEGNSVMERRLVAASAFCDSGCPDQRESLVCNAAVVWESNQQRFGGQGGNHRKRHEAAENGR